MTRRADIVIPIILFIIVAVLGAAALFVDDKTARVMGSVMTGLLAVFGTWAAVTFSSRADERAQVANSFEIARRWDQEPYLGSRDATRGKSGKDLLCCLSEKNEQVEIALIHFANLFWEIGVALKLGWADEQYLKERFRSTLMTMYPAFNMMLQGLNDEGAEEALHAINNLQARWNVSKGVS